MCRRGGSREYDPGIQAARNCALPGFDRRSWCGDLVELWWLGRRPRLDYDERGPEEYPPEDPEDGCPGAWYRTPFVGSLLKYRRRPDGNGGRVSNRMLDLCCDELVIEAVGVLEAYEDEWSSRWDRAATARLRKKE